MAREKYNTPALSMLFGARRFTVTAGMNWLQDRGYISDLCVDPQDVAPVDAERVLRMAGAEWALPAVRSHRSEI